MNLSNLICICCSVTIEETRSLIEKYPEESAENIRKALQIGSRCGSCLFACVNSDGVTFDDVYDFYK